MIDEVEERKIGFEYASEVDSQNREEK